MGRPSKLPPDAWAQIEKRLAAGESAASLAREYGVNQSQITRRVSQVSQELRNLAKDHAKTQSAIAALPPARQYQVLSLSEQLRNMSSSLASAAELGAKTAHRLHALANAEVGKVDDADPLAAQSLESLKGVGVLTKLANESSQLAVNLISANKGAVPLEQPSDKPSIDAKKLSPQVMRELLAARG